MLTAAACLVLTAALFAWVFSAKPEACASVAAVRRQALEERKKAVYENLKDLHFEHLAGKLSEADYERTRLMLEEEAAGVVASLRATRPAA
ncbi:MAG: hypothetical protein ACRD1L_04180 [Terriglobales bacterium]